MLIKKIDFDLDVFLKKKKKDNPVFYTICSARCASIINLSKSILGDINLEKNLIN